MVERNLKELKAIVKLEDASGLNLNYLKAYRLEVGLLDQFWKQKFNLQKTCSLRSVKSIHPCKSVIQTKYDIVKAHGGIKLTSIESDGTAFIVQLPV